MKSVIATALTLTGILVSNGAWADGNQLLENCQNVVRLMDDHSAKNINSIGAGQCLGMVEGVRNTIFILQDTLPKGYRVCLPKNGISNGQAARIVVKHLQDHPADLNMNATALTMIAFREAYPCK